MPNYPKLVNAKKVNLFQNNSHMSLNSIESINPTKLILPNLGKIKKINKKSNKSRSFIKGENIKMK